MIDIPMREKDMYVFSVGIKLELMFQYLIIIDDLQRRACYFTTSYIGLSFLFTE